ncbi:hypothetical protein COCMIDRAFT_106017 [Bipolaris oryzae ATCC 44560]|uniref:Uncharacterized protein n=1 Tax=Bipolaris oryzae ATCC 44560 TaxID=930090 RepID=W6Z1G5_COCMI|nr:uncharacterized protein COCMIDRAFT_106017 [Bipolaris oryzae ATCC 44560]EUC41494.1 hypothetical protein COCMIDRAFT_106017 [Bipolaris oryzae ATCC 44560]
MSFFVQQQTQYTAHSGMAIQPTPYQPCHLPSAFTPQASWDDPEAWLRNSTQDLLNDHPTSIVPGISPGQVFLRTQQIMGPYTPRDLWNVRCLSPAERHEMYVSFGVFGRTMQSHEPRSPEYISSFDLIKEKSKDIAEKEAQWYAQFADKKKGTVEQRSERFKAIVVEQMHAVDLRTVSQASSASSPTQIGSLEKQPGAENNTAIAINDDQDSSPRPLRGQKRYAPEPEAGEDCRPAKRVTPELDESVRLEREAKAEAEHQRYLAQKDMIDRIYLDGGRSRKPTDPIWQKLAAFDAFEAAKQIPMPKKKRRQSLPEEDRQAYEHLDERFKLPSRDLASYPLKTPDRYMCLHVDSGCGGSKDCTCHNHDCCRNGFTLRQLEGAIKRKYERVCSKIEEQAFIHGKIPREQKKWDNWYSKEMRDRDSTRIKACMPPLEWKPDPRMAGVNLAAQSLKAPRQAAAKKPRAKPQSALERLQKRQMEEAISQTTQAVVGEAEESARKEAEQAFPVVPTEVCEGCEQPDRVSLQAEHQEAEKPISTPEENIPENNGDGDLDVALFGEPIPSNEDGNNGLELEQPSGGSQVGLLDTSELADIFNPTVPVSADGFDNDLFAEFFQGRKT